MKVFKIITILLTFSFVICNAQYNQQASIELSYNKIYVSYKHKFNSNPLWSSIYFGIGNQDIDAQFNDPIFGIKLGLSVLSFEKSNIYGYFTSGMYFAKNDYYNANAPFCGTFLGYFKNVGKENRHAYFAEVGYIYGKKEYSQTFENNNIYIYTTDYFIMSPLNFAIGYSYSF